MLVLRCKQVVGCFIHRAYGHICCILVLVCCVLSLCTSPHMACYYSEVARYLENVTDVFHASYVILICANMPGPKDKRFIQPSDSKILFQKNMNCKSVCSKQLLHLMVAGFYCCSSQLSSTGTLQFDCSIA